MPITRDAVIAILRAHEATSDSDLDIDLSVAVAEADGSERVIYEAWAE